MRAFVKGAPGFVGSAVIRELIGAGHQVLGLAGSEKAAKELVAAGAEVHRGSLEDLESLRSGAAAADGVIHTAFIHDFSNYGPAAEVDRRAIEILGGALATEEDGPTPNFPRKSEEAALALGARGGARASVLRLPPPVHGAGDRGFVPRLISIAGEKAVSAFIGDGPNRWPAVDRLDAAHLYRLALEKGSVAARYHGVADEGVPTRDTAGVIGRQLNVPVVSKSREEAADHFGWITPFFGMDGPASSAHTQRRLGWLPVQSGLIAD